MAWYHNLGIKGLDGASVGDQFAGKALLVVNVASRCGYTPQYKGLVALHRELGGDKFSVIGVPCDQFGGQEPGSADEIATFCARQYAVDFPLLEKQDVNGDKRSALYARLIQDGPGIRWNFEKLVVDKSGNLRARFGSGTKPEDAELRAAIEEAIG